MFNARRSFAVELQNRNAVGMPAGRGMTQARFSSRIGEGKLLDGGKSLVWDLV